MAILHNNDVYCKTIYPQIYFHMTAINELFRRLWLV